MRVLRKIAEKRMVNRVRNVEIRDNLKQEGVLEKVKRSQVRWRETLEGMGPERLARRVNEAEMEDRRRRGRPRKNGMIILSNDMLCKNLILRHICICKDNLLYRETLSIDWSLIQSVTSDAVLRSTQMFLESYLYPNIRSGKVS